MGMTREMAREQAMANLTIGTRVRSQSTPRMYGTVINVNPYDLKDFVVVEWDNTLVYQEYWEDVEPCNEPYTREKEVEFVAKQVAQYPHLKSMYDAIDRAHQECHDSYNEGSIENCDGMCVFRRAGAGAH